jgi:type I restriction enzyme S subunit
MHGQLSMYGGTKQGLSLDDVKSYVLLLPPLSEQDRLVDWIERRSAGLVEAIRSAKREVCLLREYCTRLVADVVTGKLDVREAAARLPDEFTEPEPAGEPGTLIEDDDAPGEDGGAIEEADA